MDAPAALQEEAMEVEAESQAAGSPGLGPAVSAKGYGGTPRTTPSLTSPPRRAATSAMTPIGIAACPTLRAVWGKAGREDATVTATAPATAPASATAPAVAQLVNGVLTTRLSRPSSSGSALRTKSSRRAQAKKGRRRLLGMMGDSFKEKKRQLEKKLGSAKSLSAHHPDDDYLKKLVAAAEAQIRELHKEKEANLPPDDLLAKNQNQLKASNVRADELEKECDERTAAFRRQ